MGTGSSSVAHPLERGSNSYNFIMQGVIIMFVFEKNCAEEELDNGVIRRIKGWLDDLMVVELRWGKGMRGAVHSHPHRQCGYVIKGSFESEADGQTTILRAGDCVYTEAGVLHGLLALEDDSILLDIFTPCREDFIAELSEERYKKI